jgi:molecular chaperone GrpE
MANEDENGSGNGSTPGGKPDAPAGEQPQPTQATVEDLITDLEKQVHGLEEKYKEEHDRLLRTAADYENFKRRTKKELDESLGRGREQVMKEILPVMDNLERALKHATADDPLAAGVRMVEKQLLGALERFGVVRFSAVGQPFDPSMHDAIQQIESTELAPGTVAQEFASGYKFQANGRLLRPAMVAVAKQPSPVAPSSSDGGAPEGGSA